MCQHKCSVHGSLLKSWKEAQPTESLPTDTVDTVDTANVHVLTQTTFNKESATIVVMFVLSVCDIYFVMSCLLIVLFYTHVVLFHRPLCLKTFKQCPMFLSVLCYSPFPSPRGKVRLSYKLRFSYIQEST